MVTVNGIDYADWRAARAAIVEPERPAAVEAVAVLDAPEPAKKPEPEKTACHDAPQSTISREVIAEVGPKPGRRQSLTEKYRPRRLADVVGQAEALAGLASFAANPYPAAFIMAGPTGVGKTSAAWALAAELGCDIDAKPPEFGGVHSIASGDHTADSLRDLWPTLWNCPFQGSGWKVLIVNEVEQLNGVVEKLWLDRLEELPPCTVIIFTTNAVDTLPERFKDRCIGGVLEFESSAARLDGDARALAGRIWRAETGGQIPADDLDGMIARATSRGQLSFRRVVQALTPLIAARKGR